MYPITLDFKITHENISQKIQCVETSTTKHCPNLTLYVLPFGGRVRYKNFHTLLSIFFPQNISSHLHCYITGKILLRKLVEYYHLHIVAIRLQPYSSNHIGNRCLEIIFTLFPDIFCHPSLSSICS